MKFSRRSYQLSFEQERQTILRPYLVTKAKRGIIGKSLYAVRLRQEVKNATEDRQPVNTARLSPRSPNSHKGRFLIFG
jgi:transcriptional regulator with AAA-type ATPase domain